MFNRLGMFDRSLGMFQPPGSIPFNPSQIFAALQGAWLEPTPGYIWQENTGVTPTTTGGQTIGKIADLSGWGNNATQSTAANRPTYQLDSNGLPLARHDATDSLTVSLPSINVRRNLVRYTEFGAEWVHNFASIATGQWCTPLNQSCAALFTESLSQSSATIYNSGVYTTTGQPVITVSGYFKYVSRRYIQVNGSNRENGFGVVVDLIGKTITATGTTGTSTYISSSIQLLPDDWVRVVITGTTATNRAYVGFSSRDTATPYGPDIPAITPSNKQTLYAGPQAELGSTATDYQRVTDWTSEAYASSGSVYFATPVGMSALHNQSMGTTYQLPALSTDIYSWIVVPQRLSAVQESRLARWMERKAGIARPDYLLDSSNNQLTADDGEQLLLAQ